MSLSSQVRELAKRVDELTHAHPPGTTCWWYFYPDNKRHGAAPRQGRIAHRWAVLWHRGDEAPYIVVRVACDDGQERELRCDCVEPWEFTYQI